MFKDVLTNLKKCLYKLLCKGRFLFIVNRNIADRILSNGLGNESFLY